MSARPAWLIDRPANPLATLVLAHGAGSPMDHPSMTLLAAALCDAGLAVVRFEFPYMAQRRRDGIKRPPDRMPGLEQSYRELVAELRQRSRAHGTHALFLAGRSLGSRVATQLVDALGAQGAVAFGFPFHPPKKPLNLRTEQLGRLQAPCLIVQGTRDPFGSQEDVRRYTLSPAVRVHWLAAGDHAFVPSRQSGRTLAQNLSEAAAVTRSFIEDVLARAAQRKGDP